MTCWIDAGHRPASRQAKETKECLICKWFDAQKPGADGACRVNPPVLQAGDIFGRWPLLTVADWCGKWKWNER